MNNKNSFSEQVMIAFFILLIMGGGLAMGLTINRIPADFWRDLATLPKFASGEATRQFSKKINQDFIFSQQLHDIERTATWLITDDFGAGVRQGCPGWLFLTDELVSYAGADASAQLRTGIVQQLRQQLALQNIHLVVAVVPDKSRIESGHLCHVQRPAGFQSRVQHWVQPLGESALDLTAGLQNANEALYYRTDSHWNEQGAALSAHQIASRVRALQWMPETTVFSPIAHQVASQIAERPGDLLHLASLDKLPLWLGPKPEMARSSQWRVAASSSASAADDLFGDDALPKIILVGTSFSLRANFANYLQRELAVPIANVAKDGGGFDGAMRVYLNSATFKQTPPALILWEIPERVLQGPVSKEEQSWSDALNHGRLTGA